MANIPEIIKATSDAIMGTGGQGGVIQPVVTMIQDNLGTPCLEIARHIVLPILVAELAFVGIRITLKNPFADQFIKFTVTAIIAFIILSGAPQQVIRDARKALQSGGQAFAKEILSESGVSAVKQEPLEWWADWLGDIAKDGDEKTGKGGGKYNANYIFKMFDVGALKPFEKASAYDGMLQQALQGGADFLKMAYQRFLSALPTFMTKALSIEALMAMIMPLVFISMIFTAVMIQMAGYFAPVFVHIGILAGSDVMLEFVLAVGVVVVPLMFFQTFKDIWQKYLIFCAGIALIPCFYYILSAIGFVFSTKIFEAICDPSVEMRFPKVLTQLFLRVLRRLSLRLSDGWGERLKASDSQ
ncbi:MAG: hypothetical protein V1746_04470 [bacterium]